MFLLIKNKHLLIYNNFTFIVLYVRYQKNFRNSEIEILIAESLQLGYEVGAKVIIIHISSHGFMVKNIPYFFTTTGFMDFHELLDCLTERDIFDFYIFMWGN